LTRLLLLIACLAFAAPAFAQQEAESEVRSRFTQFVENQLSSENRRIRLNGIQGALSSEATIREITIADREGVWLRIVNARIVWSRLALLRGRLEVDRLAADLIEVARNPVPAEGAPPPEAGGGFAVPELPVSVRLDVIEVPEVRFGPTVFGLESVLSVNGGFTLAGGALDAELAIERRDGPGGRLALNLAYANETEVLDLDLRVSEPENGIVANALNIEGRPAVDLALVGAGPLDDLRVDLALDADGERIVTGVTTLERTGAGLSVNADVEGPVARLIAPAFQDFFGANSVLRADALLREGGGVTINGLTLETGTLSLNATAETSEDNFLRRLQLSTVIEDASGDAVTLPVSGGTTTIRNARLNIDFGADASERWSGALNVAGLSTETLDAAAVELGFGGTATGLDQPDQRALTFESEGAITGITTDDEAVASALGDRLDLVLSGAWSTGEPVRLDELALDGRALALSLAGAIDEMVYEGAVNIVTESLEPFAELADRSLAGSLDLAAEGRIALLSGGFDLDFDGTGDGLQIGTPAVDALIESSVRLAGRLARGETGLRAEDFSIENEQFTLRADGVYSSERADLTLDILLSDLALVSDAASGRLELTGRAEGEGGPVALTLQGSVPSGELVGRTLTDARFGFAGELVGIDAAAGRTYGDGVTGQVEARAFLDGEGVALDANIFFNPARRALNRLDFSAGGAQISGDVVQDAAGLITGQIIVDAPRIDTLAALALQEATGAVNADIALSVEDGRQDANVSADMTGIVFGETRISAASLQATILDLFGVPKIDGTVSGSGIAAGGVTVEAIEATASRQDVTTSFAATASLDTGTDIELAGALEDIAGGYRVAIDEANLVQGATAARLLEPTTILVEGERITLDGVALDIDGGELRASGTIAETLDLDVAIAALPLSIANTVMPDLQASGTLDGTLALAGTRSTPEIDFDIDGRTLSAAPLADLGFQSVDIEAVGRTADERITLDARLAAPGGIAATVRGSAPLAQDGQLDLNAEVADLPLAAFDALAGNQGLDGSVSATARIAGTVETPDVTFDVSGAGITANALSEAGVQPVALAARGRFANQTVRLDSATLSNPQGLDATASGTVPLEGGNIAVDARVNAFPLAVIDEIAGNQGLQGSISADATVGGTLDAPDVRFDANGTGISASALSNLGIQPLSVTAAGRYAGDAVTLDSATVGNPQGIAISASGALPIAGDGLNIRVQGNAPLTLANQPLAERGTRVSGTVDFNVGISGSFAAPQFDGMVSTSNAAVIDPEANIQLEGISILASLQGQQVTINTFQAGLSSGGTITVGGTVSLDAAADFPADISIALNQTRYADGDFLIVTASGNLQVSGPLARDPLISGVVNVDRAEIGIPDNLGAANALTDVRHVAPPQAVSQTLARAGLTAAGAPPVPTARPSVVRLDITVNAPRRIFIRGRGLDAEVGGAILLRGPVTSIQPVGSFDLIRGRLSILGRRITFDEGNVTLIGDLDPFVNLTATSQSGDTTVIITVSGRASDIDIDFSSQPQLPEDEVIARLIFDRGIGELSAFQIAQLAAAVAELSGGQNTSLLGQLRQSTGLDDLDVVTDEEGNAAVRAGRYIRDNVYLGVQAGSGGSSEITIDLDITENLKARGAAGADGDTSLGLFYERDY
jgi:translocation and assembly module TamB